MHIEQLREHCLKKKGVEETFPFDNETLVFKVSGKMFCLTGLNNSGACNLKCDPERSIELRQTYIAVKPGFHMDKKHWNTIDYNIDLNDKEILKLVDHSYELVVKGMTKKMRDLLS
ncbi:MAG: MmcQ/YjbR family DNA-binding protein [Bacteroidia bacterium]|nr:MmcQ/YjbR family DNA-binding protein [Bacteroidia bacterium]